MTRSEMREQVFKELFLIMFYKEDEIDGQCEIYKDNLSELSEADRDEIGERVKAVIPHIPELDAAIDSVSEGWKVNSSPKPSQRVAPLTVLPTPGIRTSTSRNTDRPRMYLPATR